MQFDILITPSMRHRPTRLLNAMQQSAVRHGINASVMHSYEPRAGSVLMLYGLGGRDRLPHAQAHQSKGGTVVSWDAGYWERKTPDRRYRVSINGFHCPERIMRGPNPGRERWDRSGLSILNAYNANGDIVLIGNGPKSGSVGASGWAAAKSRELRALHPKRRVVYRPKRDYIEPGVVCAGTNHEHAIETVLAKSSLVVCRHSNVAVDACRMGIPVICEDGAASAIYPHTLADEAKQPSFETRLEFLHRLAWWQWSESEVEGGAVWPWLTNQLSWQGEMA